ncbi:glycosyltransferase family 2 protein [Anaerostipes butyraticus]|uniref:Beta-glycosyltransferase n=1 Tax=Anaerostipes butyraticus TaxID=645466 RepID=A0A916QBR5_9FIRM|nr:glycosyltransferase family A protein [Anaerostipes butyraticus]GFO86216.1 beta-glycosyltransferase [Anaerostipes butyraticus]
MVLLTVFTPAYNRAHTLPRTYKSLCQQDCKDFIWLIVDDGSTDDTKKLVDEWKNRDNGFEIQYIYKENGGMHTAHNTAYENIYTELNVCIDSDDCMALGAVRKIKDEWNRIRDKGYAGIIGLDDDLNTGEIIGKGFPEGLKETTLGEYYAAGGAGDKKLVYRTDVMKKYPPYPVFEGEKYVALSYKYLLCDQEYKLRVLDEVLCDVEYQADGSTNTMWKQYWMNPNGFAFLRKLDMTYPSSRKKIFTACVHYVASNLIAGNKHYIKESPKSFITAIMFPAGWLLYKYIGFKNRNL